MVFKIVPLTESEQNHMNELGVWKPSCPTPLERLRKLQIEYYNFSGKPQDDGEIVVLDAVAESVISIFKTLYDQQFPLQKIRTIEHYRGNDDASMADNNCSAFNHREIAGSKGRISVHAYGVAIDINPVQNPYVQLEGEGLEGETAKVQPAAGKLYLNRNNLRAGMVEPIVPVFKYYGFSVWGGHWNTPLDWQHFQPPREVAEILAFLTPHDAEAFFTYYTQHFARTSTTFPPIEEKAARIAYGRSYKDLLTACNSAF